MRASATLSLALLVVAATVGCATTPAPATTTTPAGQEASSGGVPATTPAKPTNGTPPEGAPETPVFSFSRTFDAASSPYAADFQVPKAGWLCIDANITKTSGDAALTIVDASGNPSTIVSTRDGTLGNVTVHANDAPSTWHVRVDLSGFTGTVTLNVTQMG